MSERYVQRVWNLETLDVPLIDLIPVEEIAFGFLFGMHGIGDCRFLNVRSTQRDKG